jgi:hypothetical protein
MVRQIEALEEALQNQAVSQVKDLGNACIPGQRCVRYEIRTSNCPRGTSQGAGGRRVKQKGTRPSSIGIDDAKLGIDIASANILR